LSRHIKDRGAGQRFKRTYGDAPSVEDFGPSNQGLQNLPAQFRPV
jgi:hypothetical protein